jgi:hypothetical protein
MKKGQHHTEESKEKLRHINLGKKQSKESILKRSASLKKLCRFGEKAPYWKGGRLIDKKGYILIYKPEHPQAMNKGYVFEHRLIMENILKRVLTKREVVHHLNGIPSDNRNENLQLFESQKEHQKTHTPKGSYFGKNIQKREVY